MEKKRTVRKLLLTLSLLSAPVVTATPLFSQPAMAATSAQLEVVNWVNLRTKPSTSSNVINTLRPGTDLKVISKYNSYWYYVQTPSGSKGYVSNLSKYVKPTTTPPTAPATSPSTSTPAKPADTQPAPVQTNPVTYNWAVKADAIYADGQKYLGTPYKFGASKYTTDVFDCSSFTQRIYGENDVQLPRDSRQQSRVGEYVKKSDLRKGDLVFFSTGYSNGGIAHVGMYLGDGKMINSLPGKGVTVTKMDTKWWNDHYITARRVLK